MANIEWNHKIKLKNDDYFKELEQSKGIRIPANLKSFIKKTNGASPKPYCFDIGSTEHIYGGTFDFGNTGEGDNAKSAVNTIDDPSIFPFGSDPFGNFICVDLNSGNVVFWDHETDKTTNTGKSIDGFASSLHESKKDKEKSKVTTESVRDLMNRFLGKFIKKKSTSSIKLNKYTEHYGKCDIAIYLHDYKISDDMIDAAHAKVKEFNLGKFEKDLSKFVKENYDSYVEDQLEDETPSVALQGVINSRKRMLFSFRAANENTIEDSYEIWVLYKSWADEKDSTLCPEVEVSVKKDGSYSFTDFHLG